MSELQDNPLRELNNARNLPRDTPETDDLARGNHVVPTEFAQDLERQLRKVRDTVHRLRKQRAIARAYGEQMERERDEAKEQIEELIYIAGRAIDLAEIDFENDKFGVVSELRSDLERIKAWQGRARAPFSGVGFQE